MSDSDSNINMGPPPRPIKRLGIGLRAVVQIILAFVSLIFICYLAISHYDRRDLTKGGVFTLSETTQNLLNSEVMQARDEPVNLIAAPPEILASLFAPSAHY